MKQCFKCLNVLPLSDFYPHSQMSDGHLNKCKACTKSDSESRRMEKMKDPEWVESELERHRIKARTRRQAGIGLPSKEQISIARKKFRAKYPEKHKAHNVVNNAIKRGRIKKQDCQVCGSSDSEAHHDDYSKPLDVIWLCPKHHAERHVQIRKQIRALTLSLA